MSWRSTCQARCQEGCTKWLYLQRTHTMHKYAPKKAGTHTHTAYSLCALITLKMHDHICKLCSHTNKSHVTSCLSWVWPSVYSSSFVFLRVFQTKRQTIPSGLYFFFQSMLQFGVKIHDKRSLEYAYELLTLGVFSITGLPLFSIFLLSELFQSFSGRSRGNASR